MLSRKDLSFCVRGTPPRGSAARRVGRFNTAAYLIHKDEFVCLSIRLCVCMSRLHTHISECTGLEFHRQPLSDNAGRYFACFPTYPSCSNKRNYAKTKFQRCFRSSNLHCSGRVALSRFRFTAVTASVHSSVVNMPSS